MKKILMLFIATQTLLGCGIYTKYSKPTVAADDFLFGSTIDVKDSVSVEVPSWRNLFTDSLLCELIDLGLTSNTDLVLAKLSIEQSQAMFTTSKLAYVPSFMLAPQGGINSFGGSKGSASYNLPITTSWEIDIFGKLRNNKQQAKAVVEQSQEYVQMVQTQLVSAIATSYYTLLMLDEQLAITKATSVNFKQNLEVIKSLKEVGMQTEAAVRQSAANYYSVLLSIEDLENGIQIAENALALLLNQPPYKMVRGRIKTSTFGAELESSISITALSNRPDVRYSEFMLKQSFYGVNSARSAFYPSISLGGSAGWSNNAGVIVNPGDLLLSAIGSLTQPLFNRGVNRANLKIAKVNYDKSVNSFQKSLLIAGNEVNDALINYQTSKEKRVFRKKQINELEQAVIVTEELMKGGFNTYLEVLIAQNSLLQAQIYQTTDWFDYAKSRVDLYKALGGGTH